MCAYAKITHFLTMLIAVTASACSEANGAWQSAPQGSTPQNSAMQKRQASKKEVEQRRKAWMKIRSEFSAYRQKRWDALMEHREMIHRLVAETKINIAYETFVDSLMDLDSAFVAASQNRSDVERHISKLFEKQVVNMPQLAEAMQQVFNKFNEKCAELDNELLITCGIDASINPSSLKACEVDSSEYQRHLLLIQSKMTDQLYSICQAHVIATTAGLGAGAAGGGLGYELGRDSNGDATWLSGVLMIAGDMIASKIAEDISYELMETRNQTTSTARNATEAMLSSVSGDSEYFRGFDMGLVEIGKNHDGMMLNGIVHLLELDVDWVNANLPD